MMLNVLLAEDHDMVRQGTRLFLESKGIRVVGEAKNGREVVEMARTLQPDVIIMDIHMPELTGIEATRRIRYENADVRILILTAYDEPAYVHALLDAGADGFMLKTAGLSELLRILYEIAGGRKMFDKTMLKKAQQAPTLTEREIQVLQLVADGMTNKEIGKLLFISDRTVQGHLKNIYEKLNVNTRTEAVKIALQQGYIKGI